MHTVAEIPFTFEMPIEVWHKAGPAGQERRIGGIISSEMKDRQGEIVLQRGLDFSDFVSAGWINDNHSKKTTDIVGYPLTVRPTTHKGRPATYFEGYLIPDYKPADDIWKLANSLQKTNRRLGFSIEGSVQQRDGIEGEIVAKAKVRNVAVTNAPVNVDTRLEVLAKSLMAMSKAEPAELIRALAAGQSIGAPAIAPGVGFALRTESLESDRKKRRRKRLVRDEAIEVIKSRYPGISEGTASRIFNYALAACGGM